jgi:hypothetical protein
MMKNDEREAWGSMWDLGSEILALYPRHEGGLFVGGGGDLIFHGVTQGHELIDLGYDAVLLGEGRRGKCANAGM